MESPLVQSESLMSNAMNIPGTPKTDAFGGGNMAFAPSTSAPVNGRTHYNSVKMKYFTSLGMNRPPSQPADTVSRPKSQQPSAKHLSMLSESLLSSPAPTGPVENSWPPTYAEFQARKTSVSIPIKSTSSETSRHSKNNVDLGMSFAPGYMARSADVDEEWANQLSLSDEETELPGNSDSSRHNDDDLSSDDEGFAAYFQNRAGGHFVPPHEMTSPTSFQVGTAHSVAVLEKHRKSHLRHY